MTNLQCFPNLKHVSKMIGFALRNSENIVENEENLVSQYFLFFSSMFSNGLILMTIQGHFPRTIQGH